MIASSITMPTASVSASRVILLSEKSMYRISVNVAIMEVGMASAAINTARQLRMNSSTTRLARKLPRTRCSSSECTEALMKTEMSWTTSRWTPGGSSSFRVSSRRLTLSATRTVFVPDCRSTETLTASRGTWSLRRSMAHVRSSSAPSSTWPTSRTRTGAPPRMATMMLAN